MKLKYTHVPNNHLQLSVKPGDKIIRTEDGVYKVRKNGKLLMMIDQGKDNEEVIRVTRIK